MGLNMKRVVAKVCMIVIGLCILGSIIVYENREKLWSKHPQLFFVIENGDATIDSGLEQRNIGSGICDETLSLWYSEVEDIYYLFLPSYAKLEHVKVASYSEKWLVDKVDLQASLGKNNEKNPFLEKRTIGNDIPLHTTLHCKREHTSDTYQMIIMQSANLPTMYMETASGSLEDLQSSKEHSESGTARLYDAQGNLVHQDALNSIKGRGNTSFNGYNKKPWNISFDAPCNLFDMGTDTKYVLIANASDPTLIRNDYVRRLEQALQVPYVHIGQFLDLYVNGEYQGNYYLCSPVNIGDERIAITDLEKQSEMFYDQNMLESADIYDHVQDMPVENWDKEPYDGPKPELHNKVVHKGLQLESLDQAIEAGELDVTGGYLLERDYEQRYMVEYDQNASSFTTRNGECFRVKSPSDCSAAQIEYIGTFVEKAEELLLNDSGNKNGNAKTTTGDMTQNNDESYLDYVDIDCFAKRYLAEEISKNYDGGVSSTYFYKDIDANDKRLHMAPGWDYDMCLGNYVWWMEDLAESPEGLTRLSKHSTPCLWFTVLYDKPEYYEKVVTYFKQYAEPFLFRETKELISWYRDTLDASISMNHVRWSEDLCENVYYKNVDDSYRIFEEFVERRAVFLKEEWSR